MSSDCETEKRTILKNFHYYNFDGKSLAQKISGTEKIEEQEKIAEKYTEDAPQ